MQTIWRLEAEMKSAGTWVFGGRLHDHTTATVVRAEANDVLTTDGPFAETKDHLGGFYLIQTGNLDGALDWAETIGRIFRTESGRSVAALVAMFGDIDLAEDAVQDAFAIAYDAGRPTRCHPTRRLDHRHRAKPRDRQGTG